MKCRFLLLTSLFFVSAQSYAEDINKLALNEQKNCEIFAAEVRTVAAKIGREDSVYATNKTGTEYAHQDSSLLAYILVNSFDVTPHTSGVIAQRYCMEGLLKGRNT